MNNRLKIETVLEYFFIPARRNRSGKIVVVLHGKGDSLSPFKDFQKDTKLYDTEFLLLNAPKGYLDGYSWYADPPRMGTSLRHSRNLVMNILNQLIALGYESQQIYLLGYSQGCLLSFDLLMHLGWRLGGVIGVSGYFQFPERWKKRLSAHVLETPILLTHGHQDRVLPLEETYFGMRKLARAGFPVRWHELKKRHEFIDEDNLLVSKFVKSSHDQIK